MGNSPFFSNSFCLHVGVLEVYVIHFQ